MVSTFEFQGTGFTLYRRVYSTFGSMQVNVYQQLDNGSEVLVLNQTVANNSRNAWKWPEIFVGFDPDQIYRVQINNLAGGRITLDRIDIHNNTGDPLYPGVYQDDNLNIQYYGTWTEPNDNGNGGTYHRSTYAGDTATFSFVGTGLIFHHILASAFGDMEICVDGQCFISSTYASATDWDYPILLSGFESGLHSVSIRALSDADIPLNQIEVINQATTRPLRPGYYEQDNPNIVYSGDIWADKINSSGPSGNTFLQSTSAQNTMQFSFEGTGFVLYRRTASNYGTICIYRSCDSKRTKTGGRVLQERSLL